jgi:carnosine synthase
MNLLAWGVDLVEEQLLASAGIPSRPNVAARPLRNIAEYSVNALKSGTIRDVKFLEPYQGRPDVLYANPLVEAGAKVGAGHECCVVGAGWWAGMVVGAGCKLCCC